MIRQQRQAFLEPPLRVYISADEPSEEDAEEERENDPFDDHAFLWGMR